MIWSVDLYPSFGVSKPVWNGKLAHTSIQAKWKVNTHILMPHVQQQEKKRKETKEGKSKSWMRIQSEMRKRDREIFTGVLIKAIGRKLPHYKTTRPTWKIISKPLISPSARPWTKIFSLLFDGSSSMMSVHQKRCCKRNETKRLFRSD